MIDMILSTINDQARREPPETQNGSGQFGDRQPERIGRSMDGGCSVERMVIYPLTYIYSKFHRLILRTSRSLRLSRVAIRRITCPGPCRYSYRQRGHRTSPPGFREVRITPFWPTTTKIPLP